MTMTTPRLNGKEYLNYRQAISWSSNIGMVKTRTKMGDEKWMEYLKKIWFLVRARIQV